MNVDELLEQFLDARTAAGDSDATIEWYRYQIRRFFAWLVAKQLQHDDWLKPAVINRYLADSRRGGNQPATVAGHYRALRGFFRWLKDNDYLAQSPMEKMKAPRVKRKEPKRAELDEYLILLDSIPPGTWVEMRDRLIITTLFLCGVRRGECARLRQQDYRVKDHLLFVDGKNGPRLVPMLPAVEKALIGYLFVRPQWVADALFLASDGAGKPKGVMQPTGIYQMLRRRCKTANLRRLNPHSFRHGLAMYLLNDRGADMSLVQKILGHSQISTTANHYAEWLVHGLQREFAQKMVGVGQ